MEETHLKRDHHDDLHPRPQDRDLLPGPVEAAVSNRGRATGLELDLRGAVSKRTESVTKSARSAMPVPVVQLLDHVLPLRSKMLLPTHPKPLVRNKKRFSKLDTRSWHQRLNLVTADLPVCGGRKRLSRKEQRGKPGKRLRTEIGRGTRTSHTMMLVPSASEMRL